MVARHFSPAQLDAAVHDSLIGCTSASRDPQGFCARCKAPGVILRNIRVWGDCWRSSSEENFGREIVPEGTMVGGGSAGSSQAPMATNRFMAGGYWCYHHHPTHSVRFNSSSNPYKRGPWKDNLSAGRTFRQRLHLIIVVHQAMPLTAAVLRRGDQSRREIHDSVNSRISGYPVLGTGRQCARVYLVLQLLRGSRKNLLKIHTHCLWRQTFTGLSMSFNRL